MQNKLPISGPLSLGELLDRAFRLYRAHFGKQILTAALFLVPLSIITGIVYGRTWTGYLDALDTLLMEPMPGTSDEIISSMFSFMGNAMLVASLTFLVTGLVSMALMAQDTNALHGREISTGASLATALRRFPAYFGMVVIKGLAVLGASSIVLCGIGALFMGIVFAGSVATGLFDEPSTTTDTLSIGVFLLLMCGYIVLLLLAMLPYLYLAARWIAALPGLVEQRLGPLEALGRSWALTRGNVWRCVGYLVLLYLLSFVLTSLPVLIVQQTLFALLPIEAVDITVGISTGLSTIFSIIWLPLQAAAIVLLYYDLRVRHEAYDLQLRIERLEAEVDKTSMSST